MNSIEEKLWNFIDGNCSAEEHKAILQLIESDETYHAKYDELLAFNAGLSNMEMEEPSMGFNFKVMEAIRAEAAHVPLKAAINKNVIRTVVGVFVVVILGLIAYAFAAINWSDPASGAAVNFKLPDVKVSAGTSGLLLKGFFFFDVVLALYFGDAYLRKNRTVKEF